jgi:hypothetical protein
VERGARKETVARPFRKTLKRSAMTIALDRQSNIVAISRIGAIEIL